MKARVIATLALCLVVGCGSSKTESGKVLKFPAIPDQDKTELKEKFDALAEHLSKELQMLEMKNEIQSKVKVDIDQQQREFFLHQQMKTCCSEQINWVAICSAGSFMELEILLAWRFWLPYWRL